MAQDYRLYLLDEFDWCYTGTSPEAQLALCSQVSNVESATHPAYGLILVECRHAGGETLRDLKKLGVVWDGAYVQWLSNGQLVCCSDT